MKGYRSETLFDDGYTDPVEVAFYEIQELGNIDIPSMLLEKAQLTEDEAEFLGNVVSFLNEDEDAEIDEIDEEYFCEIVRKYIDGRNFCKWLCPTPKDVWSNYVEPIQKDIPFNDFADEITEYDIPEDAIKLADLGKAGVLWCWKR